MKLVCQKNKHNSKNQWVRTSYHAIFWFPENVKRKNSHCCFPSFPLFPIVFLHGWDVLKVPKHLLRIVFDTMLKILWEPRHGKTHKHTSAARSHGKCGIDLEITKQYNFF